MKISFLIHNVYGVGGTNRAVINLASALAVAHDVEIVSVFRRLDEPMLAIPGDVTVTGLVDLRPGAEDREHPDQRARSSIVPGEEEFYSTYSQLTDARLREYLGTSRRDVYIGTRPALNLAVAHWAPESAVRIAQEHQTHASLPRAIREAMRGSYGRLSAAVTVTEADATAFEELTPVPGLRVRAIPNSSPAPALPPSDTSGRLVVAAGRLDAVKQYDVLLHAFASVAGSHPDWSLRIYGAGPESGRLRGLISDLRLNDQVVLMGRHARMETEWVKAAMLVSSSERESFGMSIIEAMQAGLPVVSTRAPVGPQEIITDQQDGLLVPVGDVAALADAMRRLIDDPAERRAMGSLARRNAARYEPDRVARQYEQLFAEVRATQPRVEQGPSWRTSATALPRALARAGRTYRRRLSAVRVPAPPVVDVRVDPDGGLTFTDRSAARGRRTLVLVGRDSKERVEIPMGTDTAASTTPTGRLPLTASLPEGRWNVHLLAEDGAQVRVRAGLCDTRNALRLADPDDGRPFVRRLPYQTADGFLAVRSWVRDQHAEVRAVRQEEGMLTIEGRLVGRTSGADADVRLVAVARSAAVGRCAAEPVRTSARGNFQVTLDLDAVARRRITRHDDWDLYLESDGSEERVRLARLSDDIADRKSVMVYDYTRCELPADPSMFDESPWPTVEVRPYITVDSDVSLFVRER